jgi:hypothetical protein
MTLKEILIKRIATSRELPEATVNAIISHQFESALDATNFHNSLEISGFCKFIFNVPRAIKRMEKYNSQLELYSGILDNEETSEAVKRNTLLRMYTTENNIRHLKPKLCQD